MQKYRVVDQLLYGITSFCCRPEICVRVNGKQSKPIHVSVGLWQRGVLPPLLFIVYINWIDKYSQADECATIGNCKISRLLFADDLVLLFSTESGLQRALNTFTDTCNTAGMKISTAKTSAIAEVALRFNFLFQNMAKVALRTKVSKICFSLIALRFQSFFPIIAQFYILNLIFFHFDYNIDKCWPFSANDLLFIDLKLRKMRYCFVL